MEPTPIGAAVQSDQSMRHGMSNADMYIAQLLTNGEQSLDHAETHLAEAREALRRIRAAHTAGIQWQ